MGGLNKPSIFIGNGFNLALKKHMPDAEIHLDYKSIFNETLSRLDKNLKILNKEGHALYSHLHDFLKKAEDMKQYNLEYLLLILKNSNECFKFSTEHYCSLTNNYEFLLSEHKKLLKNTVIKILTDHKFHPEYMNIINEKNNKYIACCSNNLKLFDRIFTINYDLILYWILNNQKLTKENFKDGFSLKKQDFINSENLNMFNISNQNTNFLYLHGALHLLAHQNRAYKIVKKKDECLTLDEIRKKLLESNEFNSLIIFDATSDEKISNIISNGYLSKAYDKIRTIQSNIIIYGLNILDENKNEISLGNDTHLWQAIINSNANKIFASIEDKDTKKLNKYAEKLAETLKKYRFKDNKNIRIHCFSYNTVDIWKTSNFYDQIMKNSSSPFSLSND